jgi:hypothetical protein
MLVRGGRWWTCIYQQTTTKKRRINQDGMWATRDGVEQIITSVFRWQTAEAIFGKSLSVRAVFL